jgi:hypothetical protein
MAMNAEIIVAETETENLDILADEVFDTSASMQEARSNNISC